MSSDVHNIMYLDLIEKEPLFSSSVFSLNKGALTLEVTHTEKLHYNQVSTIPVPNANNSIATILAFIKKGTASPETSSS